MDTATFLVFILKPSIRLRIDSTILAESMKAPSTMASGGKGIIPKCLSLGGFLPQSNSTALMELEPISRPINSFFAKRLIFSYLIRQNLHPLAEKRKKIDPGGLFVPDPLSFPWHIKCNDHDCRGPRVDLHFRQFGIGLVVLAVEKTGDQVITLSGDDLIKINLVAGTLAVQEKIFQALSR